MASFLQRVFSGATLDFKGAFRANDTVKIEKNPNDPEKDVLRFGEGKDDYFEVEGTKTDKERLREILSKVVESPTMLKKIRDLPLEDRPTLIQDHGGKVNGQSCGGYCSGDVISMSVSSGTGYGAAGIFCHEFQHQYQFMRGKDFHNQNLSIPESVLEHRVCEAAADTAKYQYLYEMKGKNAQATRAFFEASLDQPGMRAYAKAKDAGKSEQDCMLAGMMGYATSFMTAKYYGEYYHGDAGETDRQTLNAGLYTDNIRSAVGTKYFERQLNGNKLDEFDAYKAHTVGMTTEEPVEQAVHKNLRSAEFNYVTPTIARALTRWAKNLKAAGKPMTEDPDKLNVRTAYGVTTNKERGGFAGMMFKAKTKLMSVVNNLKNGKDKDSLGAIKRYHDGGKVDLYVTADKNGELTGKIPFHAQHGVAEEYKADKEIGEKEVEKRTLKAQKMLAIVMKSPYAKKKIEELTAAGQEITLAFYKGVSKEGCAIKKTNTIVLDPSKSPKQLAQDFSRHFHPMANDLLKKIESEKGAEKQTEQQAAPKQAEPKTAEAKPAEAKTETKAAESKPQLQVRGEQLLNMVDEMTKAVAVSKQSPAAAYQPTDQESKTVADLAKLTENAAKGAATPEQARAARAKALGEYAQTAEGMKTATFLMQSYGRMLSQNPEKLRAHMRAQANQGQSLMGELNKRQAKNNAAKAAQTAQAARAQTGASR